MTQNLDTSRPADNTPLFTAVSHFPESPGVYLMKDSTDIPLYIGKAKNLRSRVKSYFLDSNDNRLNIPVMLKKVDHIDWIATNNATEALILEANLIRNHQPKYNVNLRDDKHYPYLKVTVQEPFPRCIVVRRVERDGSRYFGPYTDVTAMRRLMSFAKRIFKLRDCKLVLPSPQKKRPCINYSIHQCSGPCCYAITQEHYFEQVNNLIRFLSGKRKDLIDELALHMEKASTELRFEDAAHLRDQIKLIQDASRIQQVDLKLNDTDFDTFGVAEGERSICLAVLQFRDGLLVNSHHFLFAKTTWTNANPSHDNLFVQFYLERGDEPPALILIPENAGFSLESLQQWVNQQFIHRVEIIVPQRGNRKHLIFMSEKNAFLYLNQKAITDGTQDCNDLQEVLKLPVYPQTIEAFDISNLGTSFSVAGMVQFKDGKPNKSAYRHYKIKTVSGQNDFAMMMEVVTRRLVRLQNEQKPFPDLLLIDGGPGQLHAAQKSLLAFKQPPMIASLAKQEEILYTPYLSEPLRLPSSHPARKLVERIRDEVHRYAISFHRQLRDKQISTSQLEQIQGIGKKRAATLLKKFGSLPRLCHASVEEIMQVPGISKDMAFKIRNFGLQ